jgi:D-alanyl-D-alanine carboxypeptidase
MKHIFFLQILITLLTGCTSMKDFNIPVRNNQGEINNSVNSKMFQSLLDSFVNKHKIVGIQIAVKTKTGEIWCGSSGTTEPNRLELLNNDHIIRIGSLSKTFTAIIIMQLYENDKLNLDDKISKWFPDFPESDRITIKMLLNHSSGIEEFLGLSIFIPSTFNPAKIWQQEEIYSKIKDKKLLFPPGEDNIYANSNYFLLGIIAEKITGKSLSTLIKDNIIRPLKLNNTYFLPDKKIPTTLINGYDRDLIPLPGWFVVKPNNTSWSSSAFGSGSMASTAKDILSFYNAFIDYKLIGDSCFNIMLNYQDSKSNKDLYQKHFGLGVFMFDQYKGFYGHQGLFIGSESIALFNKDNKSIFVMITNVSTLKEKDVLISECLDKLE